MSAPRTNFRVKLSRIYDALCSYTEDVIHHKQAHILPDIKLRYAIILNAVDDLHFGNAKQQQKAIDFFKSETFEQYCLEIPTPKALIERIIYSPEEYNSGINYEQFGDEEEDLYL